MRFNTIALIIIIVTPSISLMLSIAYGQEKLPSEMNVTEYTEYMDNKTAEVQAMCEKIEMYKWPAICIEFMPMFKK